MLVHRVLLCLAVLSAACGAPPEEEAPPPPPPPVTLVDNLDCYFYADGISWSHNAYRYSDGSIFAACEIADTVKTISNVALWRSAQKGAADSYCQMVADWDVGTRGWWSFSLNGMTSTATYNDAGSPKHGTVITMPCTKF